MDNKEVFVFTGGPPPNWLESHSWYAPVRVAPAEKMPLVGLKKLYLKMSMCCMKCAEIISEELREVPGVMDVIVDYKIMKVTVIGAPFAGDVLKRARKVDKKAQWWPEPLPTPPKKEESKKEKKEEKEEKKEKKKKKKRKRRRKRKRMRRRRRMIMGKGRAKVSLHHHRR